MRLSSSSVFQTLEGLPVVEPPEARSVPDLDRPVLDPQKDRLGGAAAHDDGVEAGELELRRPVAAGLGLGESARQGRLRPDGVAVEAGERRAGDHAAREDQDVLG